MHPSVALEAPAALTVEEVYRQHGTLLMRWTSRLAGPHAELDEAMQEVLFEVHRSLPRFRGEAKLTTWLYQLTRRVVARSRRRERVRRWLLGTSDADHDVESSAPGPVELVERRQRSALLYRALEGLSEKHRTAFLLFEMEQLPAEEIARIMKTRPGTIWVWLHRARARLRELLEEQEGRP
jgi:RNA polymerase sigma-70 factor (ECF subfamily)